MHVDGEKYRVLYKILRNTVKPTRFMRGRSKDANTTQLRQTIVQGEAF